MREPIKDLVRRGADYLGQRYLAGAGVRKLRSYLPAVRLSCLDADWDDVLVLAPHPDDEVFGACLLLKRLQERGKRATIAYITNGGAYCTGAKGDRKREAEASALALGAQALYLDCEDGRLQDTADLAERIALLCARVQPQVIVLPWFGDYHHDHRALALAAISRPYPRAQYLFYATFSPLWPGKECQLFFITGGEEQILTALEGYRASVNGETVKGFLALRRTLAGALLNTDCFWEPYLSIPGVELAAVEALANKWPHVYPTLKRTRHWREFIQDVNKLARIIGTE